MGPPVLKKLQKVTVERTHSSPSQLEAIPSMHRTTDSKASQPAFHKEERKFVWCWGCQISSSHCVLRRTEQGHGVLSSKFVEGDSGSKVVLCVRSCNCWNLSISWMWAQPSYCFLCKEVIDVFVPLKFITFQPTRKNWYKHQQMWVLSARDSLDSQYFHQVLQRIANDQI